MRRIRVARWSIWNKFASRSLSCSPCSRSSISRICRSTNDCDRRDKLTNIALTLPRSAASFDASRTASRCTWSNARATSPISSVESTSIGATSSGAGTPSPSLSLIRRTVSGSRIPATSSAPARNRRSGRTIERTTIMVNSSARPNRRRTAIPTRMALVTAERRSALAWSMTCVASDRSTEPIWPIPLVMAS